MSIARVRAIRGLQSALRQNGSARPALASNAFRNTQTTAKRFASDDSHGDFKPSSDLPWLIGAIVVTVPSCYYLWPAPHSDDHHDDHGSHDEHGEQSDEHTEEHDSEDGEKEEPSGDDADEKPADDGEEKKDDNNHDDGEEDSSSESKDSKSESKEVREGGGVEGVGFKGKLKDDSDGATHTAKSEDDKGTSKKRLDSGLQKNLGPSPEDEDGKLKGMSQQQQGMSNTQTRHSIPIHEDPGKSKKPDGTPETARTVGTVNKKS